jgi:Interleukin-like EMT inducer
VVTTSLCNGDTGITLLTVDPVQCSVISAKLYDTYGSWDDATMLATYIESVPDNTVLVGITGDEPTSSLEPALDTLAAIGAPVADVNYRGSFVFIAQKGYAYKTVLRKSNSTIIPSSVRVALLQGNVMLKISEFSCAIIFLRFSFLSNRFKVRNETRTRVL